MQKLKVKNTKPGRLNKESACITGRMTVPKRRCLKKQNDCRSEMEREIPKMLLPSFYGKYFVSIIEFVVS